MTSPQSDPTQDWKKFLNPDSLKSNLILASLYLAAYEMLQDSVISQLKDFYDIGFDENGSIYCPSYQAKVLSRHKSDLRASLLWLEDMNVISMSDLDLVDRIREHRNEIAHELPKFLTRAESDVKVELIVAINKLIIKIDQWWFREIEIPTSSNFTPEQLDSIDFDGVMSGRMMFFQIMLDIVTGDEEQASANYSEFTKATSTEAHKKI